ncbi:MAG: hypothetical protein JXA71_07920 [Chitinispirillaceae bacterium]|nr:hypothetical protein [Chitinispirillaceae bacterium]
MRLPMRGFKRIAGCAALLFSLSTPSQAQFSGNVHDTLSSGITLSAAMETGFLAVLAHDIQFSRSGTSFSYVDEGGQDVLFPVTRFSLNLTRLRHTFVLLYQPLRLETTALPSQDLIIDDERFRAGTPVAFLYDFPFYRFSYLYELTPPGGRFDAGVGVTMQIRNATITFATFDGSDYRANRNIGIVPALKYFGAVRVAPWLWLAVEADGIYAPVSYLNGDNNDVTGAILDASVRAGLHLGKKRDAFLNVRYLGGGAEGQSDNSPPPGDGYVNNWLHFLTVSVGFSWGLELGVGK